MQPHDWDLLEFVEEQGFATQKQLKSKYFKLKGSCSRRLRDLCKHGYLQRRELRKFFPSKGEPGSRASFFPHILNVNLSPTDYVYFIGREYSKGFGKSSKLFKPSMVLHQLILNEVRDFVDRTIEHKILLNDPKLQIASKIQFGRNEEIVPDLSYEFDKVRIAVELERTLKGMVRYFKRFSFFRDSIYTHVIYYYTDECQLKTLLARAGNSSKFAFAHYKFPNELYSNVFGPITLNDFIYKVSN